MKRAHDEIDGEPVAAAGSVKSEPESNGAPDVKGEPVEADGGGAGGAAAAAAMKREAAEQAHRRRCPYLDTINRHVLDFDFEKVSSVGTAAIVDREAILVSTQFKSPFTFTTSVTLTTLLLSRFGSPSARRNAIHPPSRALHELCCFLLVIMHLRKPMTTTSGLPAAERCTPLQWESLLCGPC
eukprot:TRINITY_DN4868_c0_g2_i1.p1 TRINITY_DN4868_c0_g2~~TRINITY_DN4868_c0_g2_i1.p1  ORF type:complete len:203 (-),score=16.39 TRINITY_DN4868_c0_g2_i1:2107-2655(-)